MKNSHALGLVISAPLYFAPDVGREIRGGSTVGDI